MQEPEPGQEPFKGPETISTPDGAGPYESGQEPATQQSPTGLTETEIKQARGIMGMAATMRPTDDFQLSPDHLKLFETIENPQLRMMVSDYTRDRIQYSAYSDLLSDSVADGTSKTLHDFLSDPQIAVGGAFQDFGKGLANAADTVWNFVKDQTTGGPPSHHFREGLAGVAEWTTGEAAGELYGYDGNVEDYYKEALGNSLVEAAKAKAEREGDPRIELFKRLPKDQQVALAMEQVYSQLDKESEAMGFWDNAEYGAKTLVPHLAVWMMTEGAAASKFGGMVGGKVGSSRFSARLIQHAPRLGKLFNTGTGLFAAGAMAGAMETVDPLTPLEKDYVHQSADPQAAKESILQQRMVYMTLSWPLFHMISDGGGKVTKALNERSGEALGRRAIPTWMKARNGFAGGFTTGTGFAMLPMFDAITNQDDREAMYGFVEQAFAGELDTQELKAWAGQSFGGSSVPFAIMGAVMNMRAMPGMSKTSRHMIDRIADDIVRNAPPEIKELLTLERVHATETASRVYKTILHEEIARDVANIVHEGKSEALIEVNESAIADWLQKGRPGMSRATAEYQAKAAVKKTGEKSGEEVKLEGFLKEAEPLSEQVEKDVKKGNFSIKDWAKGDTGSLLEAAYSKMFLRRIWAQKHAADAKQGGRGVAEQRANKGVGRPEAAQGQIGEGQRQLSAPAVPQGKMGAGKEQKRLEGRNARMPSAEQLQSQLPAEPAAPPSQPNGPKWPKRMVRITKEMKAWSEAARDIPAVTAKVNDYVEDRKGRIDTMAAVGRVIGDHAPKVVEQWDDIVESPEWDNAAANIVAFFGKTIGSEKGRASVKQMSSAVMKEIQKFAKDPAQPVGSTQAVNEGQIMRRVVGALMETPGGTHLAEWMLSKNTEYLVNLFAREKGDADKVKTAWAKGRKQFQVYVPAKNKAKGTPSAGEVQRVKNQERKATNLVAKGVLQSIVDHAKVRVVDKAPPEEEATAQTQAKPAEPEAAPATTEPSAEEKAADELESVPAEPDTSEPTKEEQIVADMGKGQVPSHEKIGGALVVRTSLPGTSESVYTGTINLGSILRHPDLQPRAHEGGRRVDERRVANYVANFKPGAVNPGKFAWLEKDGKEGWYLLDGHHTSATLEDVGQDSMMGVFLKGLTWEEAMDIAHAQNAKREDLTTIETAKAVARMAESDRFGGLEEVGKEWNKNAAWAQAMVDIANLPDAVHSWANTGNFGKSQDMIKATLAKMGEAKRMNPDAMNDMALERVAKHISRFKWYNSQGKVRDFLDVYQKVTTAEQERADSSPQPGGFLFEDFAPTAEAMDIIAQITEARAGARSASTSVKKAKAQMTAWGETATKAEATHLRGAIRSADRQQSLADQKLRYLDLVKDRVLSGEMNIDEATDAAAVTNAEEIQSFLEGITKPTAVEPTEIENGLDHPTVGNEIRAAARPDDPRSAQVGKAGNDAGGKPGSEGAGSEGSRGDAGKEKSVLAGGKPAGELVTAVEAMPEGFRPWTIGGKEKVYSSRAAAIRAAQELVNTAPHADYVVFPENAEKPTGRSRIGWRERVKKAVGDFMDKVKDRPDFQEAMKKLKDIGGDVTNLYSGLSLEAMEAAIDIGKIFLEVGMQSAKGWGEKMVANTPKKVHPYLRQIWNMMIADPAWEHLPSWTETDSKAVGVPARKPTVSSRAAKEYKDAFRTPTGAPGLADRPHERLTLDDQVESVRKEDLERARGLRASDETFLMDPFLADLPEPTQKVTHPIRENLRDHQKFLADTFVTALTDGKKGAVLDSSGTGTGKTWTTMATALEMQQRNGGKIVLTTSNNAAIESWRINDFNGMGIDPERVGFLKDINDPTKDIILASYYNFQQRTSRLTGEKVGKLGDLDRLIGDGTVKTMIWDEGHRAGTWIKGTTEAQRVVERMDAAHKAGVSQIMSSASPFDDPTGMRWMQSLGIWGEDFRGFLEDMGYSTTSKGKGEGFTVKAPDKKVMPYVHMKLIRLRQMLAEQGQQVGWDLSAEGVENVFMKLEYNKEQGDRYWAVAESYEFLRDALADAGMRQLSTMSGAWRVNHAKRMIEDIATHNAIKFAISAFERGGRFLFLSSYKSAKKSGSIEGILTKPRGNENTSALQRIEKASGSQAAAKVLQMARKNDAAMGSQPAILDTIDKALRARGMRGMKVSGDILPAARVGVLERWKDEKEDLDFLVGTRATLGESISAHDTYGRQIFQFIASIPWTGREVVQELGRAHRLNEVTKPVIAWGSAEEFPASVAMVQKVAARLHHLRAGVQGMRSDPTNLANAKDTAAFFLSAKESEQMVMSDVLALESEILKARRYGKPMPATTPLGVDLTDNAVFFDEPGAVRTPKQAETSEVEESTSEAHNYGSFEAWKVAAAEKVEKVFEDLDPEDASDAGMFPFNILDMAQRSAAARDLSKMMQSRDVRGAEVEAREHLDSLTASRMESMELPTSGEEGLKMPKGAKGGEAGALDLKILTAPYKLGKFMLHAGLRTFWADPLHYERPEFPQHLNLSDNRFNRSLRKWLDDPINSYGYRTVEPFLESYRDWSNDMRDTARAYEAVRKAALRDQGYPFFQNEGLSVSYALNGERYDASKGPKEGRLGRIEEYQNGAREWTDEIKQRASEEGYETAEAWLEEQPTYMDLMRSGEVKDTTKRYYQFSRDLMDRLWILHLSNSADFKFWSQKKEHAFRHMEKADREGNDGFDLAAKEYAKASGELESFFNEKGIEDYFSHIFVDRKNSRTHQPWFKKLAGKQVHSDFVSKGRVSWETGWLENPETVVWTYATQMLRKAYLDRAQAQVEPTIEGEWKRVSANSLAPVKETGPQYTTGGRLVDSLTQRGQEKVQEKGDVMKFAHSRVRYQGKAYDAFPGQKRGNLRGLVLREPQAAGTSPEAARPNELFFTPEEAAGLYLEARVGGLRQVGEGGDLMANMEQWLNRMMGSKEYTKLDRVIDAHTGFFYQVALGFLSLPIAGTNLLGGQVMNMTKLGPVAVARGLATFMTPGQGGKDLRNALKHSGLFSKSQLAFQMERIATYRQTREGKAGQMMETARLAVSRVGAVTSDVLMAPFLISEAFNKLTSFAAGYTSGKAAGYAENQARLQGLRAVGSTQFWYVSPNTPMASWSSLGRSVMHLNSYGVKHYNVMKLDVGQGWRGMKDSMGGNNARPGDVKGAANSLRYAMYAYMGMIAAQTASQYIMNTVFGDDEEENEGLDPSYVFGTKVRGIAGGDKWWVPLARSIKEKTDGKVDLEDAFLPIMYPFGASMPVNSTLSGLEFGWDAAAGDPRASDRFAMRQQRYYVPAQMRRFLQIQDVGGEDSEIDKKVEEWQERLRGFGFNGMTPFDSVPEYKDYRKLGGFYDVQRPFLMEDDAGNEWYSASGPMTVSKFFLMGIDPRVERSMEFNEEMAADRDIRNARKEYVRDTYKGLEIERMEGGLPNEAYEERLKELRGLAKENNIPFDSRRLYGWRQEAKELHLPGAKRIKSMAADKFQAWEFLVGSVEKEAVTFSEFYEAHRDMRKNQDQSYLDWIRVPGNSDRLQDALLQMGEKRESTEKRTKDADAPK